MFTGVLVEYLDTVDSNSHCNSMKNFNTSSFVEMYQQHLKLFSINKQEETLP